MIPHHRLAGLSLAMGLGGLLAACSGTSSVTSPSAVEPPGVASSASHGASGSGSGSSGGGSQPIRVRCEVRSGDPRSEISVDGNNLAAGNYFARVQSGGNTAMAGPQATVGDEVEFDFDSAPDDIAAGDTAIPADFIQGGVVTGTILNSGGAVVSSATVACRVR